MERRRRVLRYRMQWPPMKPADIGKKLKVKEHVIKRDIEWLRTKFNIEYFAKTEGARAARAIAEVEVIAFQLLAEIDQLTPLKAFAAERANMYGKVIQALNCRNQMLLESGLVPKAAQKIETSGPDGAPIQIDVTTTTVEQRIQALTMARQRSDAPIEI